jgi:hypothetical protein
MIASARVQEHHCFGVLWAEYAKVEMWFAVGGLDSDFMAWHPLATNTRWIARALQALAGGGVLNFTSLYLVVEFDY